MPRPEPRKRPFRDILKQERRARQNSPAPSGDKPPLRLLATTLWEYPSQHYDQWIDDRGVLNRAHAPVQGTRDYTGATPSWVIWQCLMRWTRPGDTVVDPMCGGGTTLDVSEDLGRTGIGFDLAPSRPDIRQADARHLPLSDNTADFAFIDPPYSTHIDYSNDPRCIGKLDAGGPERGRAYFRAMEQVIDECARILRPGGRLALYVSDSWRKGEGFMPIGFELFTLLRRRFEPFDIIAVVRHNQKLSRGNWRQTAEEHGFFLRGFNYLFVMGKPLARSPR